MKTKIAIAGIAVAGALFSGCAVTGADEEEASSIEEPVTAQARPAATSFIFNASPATYDNGVWRVTGIGNIQYTAVVIDDLSGGGVTGGYVQFQVCYEFSNATECSGRFDNLGGPIPVNSSSGTASITSLTQLNQNLFIRFKYLPRGSGYQRGVSPIERIVSQ